MQVKFRSSSTFAAFQVLSSHARPVPLPRIGKPWSAGTVPGSGFLPRGPETAPPPAFRVPGRFTGFGKTQWPTPTRVGDLQFRSAGASQDFP